MKVKAVILVSIFFAIVTFNSLTREGNYLSPGIRGILMHHLYSE